MMDIENTITEEALELNTPSTDSEEVDELSLLKGEIASLREELRIRDEKERVDSRILKELSEFREYFPDVDVNQIPDEVWQQVRGGASMSAAFALNLRKLEISKSKVEGFNNQNRRLSAGSLLDGEGEKYYSPLEVKKMTPAQVKAHYDEIIESMRHWN